MARLFITPREIDFISDINKEIVKDIVGQKIYYYAVREDLTAIHEVYEEAINKVFNPPINIDARVTWAPSDVKTDQFGMEYYYGIEVYLQARDLTDKEITAQAGDYFSYGDIFFEITSVIAESNIYGQVEHSTGVKLVGRQSRLGQIDKVPIGPTSENYADPDAVQWVFLQQRGFKKNVQGPTGDKRALIEDGKLDTGITGPKGVTPKGGEKTKDGTIDSSFYGDGGLPTNSTTDNPLGDPNTGE